MKITPLPESVRDQAERLVSAATTLDLPSRPGDHDDLYSALTQFETWSYQLCLDLDRWLARVTDRDGSPMLQEALLTAYRSADWLNDVAQIARTTHENPWTPLEQNDLDRLSRRAKIVLENVVSAVEINAFAGGVA